MKEQEVTALWISCFVLFCLLKGTWELTQPHHSHSHTPAEIQGLSCLCFCCCCCRVCNFQKTFLAEGTLPSCSEVERWLDSTHHSSCLAWKFLREGLYGFNSGRPQTVFATFSNLPDTLWEKIQWVSSMVCWWEHVCETFLLLLLYFLLCQVLFLLCCSCLQHMKTLHSPHCSLGGSHCHVLTLSIVLCSSGVIWKVFLNSQRLWSCFLHGQHSTGYEIKLWKSVLLWPCLWGYQYTNWSWFFSIREGIDTPCKNNKAII